MLGAITNILQEQPLDLVVANAGVTLYTQGKDDHDAIYQLYQVNLFGVLNTILPCMKRMQEGTICIMSSHAGNLPLPSAGAFYSSSKAAVLYLQGLRKDLGKVELAMIQPGYIRTAMTEKVDETPMLKPFILDLEPSAQYMVKELEHGNLDITFPIMGHFSSYMGILLPPFIRDKLWKLMPNLILGERLRLT
jgi:short-subunit dehydrogenase